MDHPRPDEHRPPRGREGTRPGRILLVRNVETPLRSGHADGVTGKPTVREAQLLERDRMTQKRVPVRRKATGNRRPARRRPPPAWSSDNWPDTGMVARPERVLTGSGEPDGEDGDA